MPCGCCSCSCVCSCSCSCCCCSCCCSCCCCFLLEELMLRTASERFAACVCKVVGAVRAPERVLSPSPFVGGVATRPEEAVLEEAVASQASSSSLVEGVIVPAPSAPSPFVGGVVSPKPCANPSLIVRGVGSASPCMRRPPTYVARVATSAATHRTPIQGKAASARGFWPVWSRAAAWRCLQPACEFE